MSGRFDSLTPACQQTFVERLPDCRQVLLDSGHYGLWEDTDRYLAEVRSFIDDLNEKPVAP